MVKAVDFFILYLTVDMIDFIVNHTNSYAWEHITDNSHRTSALPDGSWQETNRDEIRRLIVRSFVTEHLPRASLERRNCVVCYKLHKNELRVNTFCSAPQCGCYMHLTCSRDCFSIYHSAEYHK